MKSLIVEPLSPGEREKLIAIVIRLDACRAELGQYLYSGFISASTPQALSGKAKDLSRPFGLQEWTNSTAAWDHRRYWEL